MRLARTGFVVASPSSAVVVLCATTSGVYDRGMDRVRAKTVSTLSFMLALASGVGAGVYWGWWNGKQGSFGGDPVPAMWPWIALAALALVSLTLAVVLEVVLFLTPER